VKKLRRTLDRFKAWRQSRKARKLRRSAQSVADTTAAGVGFTMRLALKIVMTILLIFVTTGLLFTCIFAVYVKTCLTSEDLDISLEEAALSLSSTIWYEDSNGEMQELATLYSTENRIWVDYEDIPIDLEHAAVAIEDQRFYTHKGVDWYRTVAAFANMFVSMADNFGGSTITQQLIKNVTEYDDVTVQRKLLEIFRALEFEKTYTKSEIMTWYLNEIYLGEGCYGVGTAAQMYFGKDVSELTLAECASLIGITNNPSLYDPYISEDTYNNNWKRRDTILWEMYDQGYIDYDQYTEAVNTTPSFQHGQEFVRETTIYSYYVDTIIRDVVEDLAEEKGISKTQAERLLYNGGYNIYSCIDMRIQNIVDSVYENTSSLPTSYRSSGQQLQSAIVIMDPYTGYIVALSGGVGEKTGSLSGNRATISTRPPGSSLKPLSVYAPAIDLGLVSQDTQINDSPNLTLSGTSWYPKNSGNSYTGWTTIREALQSSRNTVAAQLLDMLGLQTSWDYLTNHFGLSTLVKDEVLDDGSVVTDYAYSPLSLGQLSYGVTVRDMAQAYTAFVNDGIMTYGRTYYLITDSNEEVVLVNSAKQVSALKANTAWNMCDMLQNAVKNGTGTDAYFSSTAVAGKTGTTSDDKDRYFVGFTMYYVAAVWTGYDTPEQMYFSGNPAAQIFKTIMSQVHEGLSYWDFPTPTITSTTVTWDYDEDEAEATETPEPTEDPDASPSPSPTAPPPTENAVATAAPTPVVTAEPTTPPATEPPPEPTPVEPVATEPPPAATEPPPAEDGSDLG
jgi:penicillin-binding protein 1A